MWEANFSFSLLDWMRVSLLSEWLVLNMLFVFSSFFNSTVKLSNKWDEIFRDFKIRNNFKFISMNNGWESQFIFRF